MAGGHRPGTERGEGEPPPDAAKGREETLGDGPGEGNPAHHPEAAADPRAAVAAKGSCPRTHGGNSRRSTREGGTVGYLLILRIKKFS